MNEPTIRFDDGAAYEAFMGAWSALVGDAFLDWLSPPDGWRWLDVGCGNGAFTTTILARCAPVSVDGVDPSDGQLAFARTRTADPRAAWRQGDAMALPHADGAFDAATMALVLFFVPDPVRGVAEMARVVRPGGSVSAYAWDVLGGGFPYVAFQEELAALGRPPLHPPSVAASRLDAMRALWEGAGLVDVRARPIRVERTFVDFEAFWTIGRAGPPIAPHLAAMPAADVDRLRERLRARLPVETDGTITYAATANAIHGVVPG